MVLNYIWAAFFIIAFAVAAGKLVLTGDTDVFTRLINATFDSSKSAFEISLGLTGLLSLWLGLMKIGENSGMIGALSRWLSPLFCRLFPDIPKGHPAMGSIFMNFSANMLGLDNAATPLGLKAMKELQELNPKKDTATNPMIMFLVINTSGLILIPVSIMMYRAQMGAAQPTDIFIPTLLTTTVSTLVGIAAVSISQRINLLCRPVLLLVAGIGGTEPGADAVQAIRDYRVGGIILFGRNVESAGQLVALTNGLKELNGDCIPLFLGVDQEGGRVDRMPPEVDNLASAYDYIAGGGDPLERGSVLAAQCAAFGFNLNFSTCLDIWSNPDNTVIGDRAYGSEPDTVTWAAQSWSTRLGVSSVPLFRV